MVEEQVERALSAVPALGDVQYDRFGFARAALSVLVDLQQEDAVGGENDAAVAANVVDLERLPPRTGFSGL